MRKRQGRRASWWMAASALAVLLLACLLLGVWKPIWSGGGRVVVGLTEGRIEVAWGTVPISRAGPAWKIVAPQMTAHLVLGPTSSWLPSTSRARAAVGTPAAMKIFPLRAVYVPLWPWVVAFTFGAAGLWRWGPRRFKPGTCFGCGYDLVGLTSATCPECGEPIMQSKSLVRLAFSGFFKRVSTSPLVGRTARHSGAAQFIAAGIAALVSTHRAIAQQSEAAPPKLIVVRILDEGGSPVAGAEVGSMASSTGRQDDLSKIRLGFYGEKNEPLQKSDKEGRVAVDPQWVFYGADDTRPQSLIAWTPDHERMGFLLVSRADAGREMDLKLAPVCRVTVKLGSKGLAALERKLVWSNAYIYWKETRPIARDATNGIHEFLLPPGEYKLYAYGQDTYTEQPLLKVEPGEKEKTIEVDLPPNRLVQLIGKPAPELTKIKGWKNGEATTLASLKGKVVILDFWGYWCGPCVHSLPELMEVHDKYKDQGLVIIAVHDDSVASIAEMDQKLEKVKADVWKGRDLPFLVALDGGGETKVEGRQGTARGATTAAYGINSFPTTVLIDREGNVVGRCRVKETGLIEKALGLQK